MTVVVVRRLLVLLAVIVVAVPGVGYVQTMNHAALVVQFEDGSSKQMCVAFAEPEIRGIELLNRSGISYKAQSTGMGAAICEIDGLGCDYPATESDCFCKSRAPTNRYWALFSATDDTWNYATVGVSSSRIHDGDAQAWVWGPNGIKEGDAVNFTDICLVPTAVVPTLTPQPSPTPRPPATARPSATPQPPTATAGPTRRPPASTPRAPATRTPFPPTATARAAATAVRPSATPPRPSATRQVAAPTAVVPTATVGVPTALPVVPSPTVRVVPTVPPAQPTSVQPPTATFIIVVPTDPPIPVFPTSPPGSTPTDTPLPTATVGFNANAAASAYPFSFGTALPVPTFGTALPVPTIASGGTATTGSVPATQPSPSTTVVALDTPTPFTTAVVAGGSDEQTPTNTNSGGSLRDPLLFVLVCAVVGAIIWKLRQRQAAND